MNKKSQGLHFWVTSPWRLSLTLSHLAGGKKEVMYIHIYILLHSSVHILAGIMKVKVQTECGDNTSVFLLRDESSSLSGAALSPTNQRTPL